MRVKFYINCLVALLAALVLFSACQKKKAFKEEDGQSSVDNRDALSENDQAVNDINDAIGAQGKLRGKGEEASGTTQLCGASVDTTYINQGVITLNYNGTTCSNRKRTGAIRLTLQSYTTGKRWKDQGAVVMVEFLNYKVERASDDKSITLNGVQYLTNETGGTWWEFLILKTQPSLGIKSEGNSLQVTFDDGKTASYNIHRRVVYTMPTGDLQSLTCTAEGTGSLNGLGNLENYGLTRDGDEFTSQVVTPIVWNWTCGWWAPIQGEVNVKVDSKEFTLNCLFGVNSSGNSVNVGANDCPYGWKVEWKLKKKTRSKVIRYS